MGKRQITKEREDAGGHTGSCMGRHSDSRTAAAGEASAETAAERTAEAAMDQAAERTAEAAMDQAAERAAETAMEQAAERAAEAAMEQAAESTAEAAAGPADKANAAAGGETAAEAAAGETAGSAAGMASGKEKPSVSVDVLLFTVSDSCLKVLLLKRGKEPFSGCWSVPGGFIYPGESAEETARRRLEEKAGVRDVHLEQLYTFSAFNRDPRTWVISIAYLAIVPENRLIYSAGRDTSEADLFRASVEEGKLVLESSRWGRVSGEELAFDHAEMILTALMRMRGKIDYTDLAFAFLDDLNDFSLVQLQDIYQAVLGKRLDQSNFRRSIRTRYVEAGRIAERSAAEADACRSSGEALQEEESSSGGDTPAKGRRGRPAVRYRVAKDWSMS